MKKLFLYAGKRRQALTLWRHVWLHFKDKKHDKGLIEGMLACIQSSDILLVDLFCLTQVSNWKYGILQTVIYSLLTLNKQIQVLCLADQCCLWSLSAVAQIFS